MNIGKLKRARILYRLKNQQYIKLSNMPFISTTRYLDYIFETEERFCQLYPLTVQKLDKLHWSPLTIIWEAVKFLAKEKDAKILDIGSGAGKFCLAGAYYKPTA